MGFLNAPIIRRIRQNHALEHATMHMLAGVYPPPRLVGRSDWTGFTLYGPVETRAVLRAVVEGLARLKQGQGGLAVHPRCGTNLVIAALLVGGVACVAMALPTPSRFRRLLGALLGGAAAFSVAQPLGLAMQRRLTTTTDMQDVHVRVVRRELRGRMTLHRICIDATR